MTASITDQIKEIQQTLRKQAERLGQLNVKHNQYLEDNEKLARQIIDLRNKVSKKQNIIEQQNKDKMIIHQKLIKAERQKQKLQIQQINRQTSKQKHSVQNNFIMEQLNNNNISNTSSTPYQNEDNDENQNYNSAQKKHNSQQKQQQFSSPRQHNEQFQNRQNYVDSDRGSYQPPVLFEQNTYDKKQNDDSSDDDEDQKQILQRLRSKIQDLSEDEDD